MSENAFEEEYIEFVAQTEERSEEEVREEVRELKKELMKEEPLKEFFWKMLILLIRDHYVLGEMVGRVQDSLGTFDKILGGVLDNMKDLLTEKGEETDEGTDTQPERTYSTHV